MGGMKTLRLLLATILAIAPFATGQETRIVRAVEYRKLAPLTPEQVTHAFQDRGVRVAVEQPYSAAEVERAKTVLGELLTQSGRGGEKVEAAVTEIRPRSVRIVFTVADK